MSYKNFKQTDSRWSNNAYSGYTIKSQGCGPTSIADAVYDLNKKITPAKIAKWMEENGCSCHGSGTYYSGMVKGLKHYGYEAMQCNYSSLYGKTNTAVATDFLKKIKSGKYIGIACMGKSIWTTSGHYVFIRKVSEGHIYIYDPYNTSSNCELTTRNQWEKYVKYLFLIKKPLGYIVTDRAVQKRVAPKTLAKTKTVGKFAKGTRLAYDKVQGNYLHIMGVEDVWIHKKNTSVTI